MKRKDFLNISTKAALFLGIAPSIACSNNQHKTEKEVVRQKFNELLNKKSLGSVFGLTAPKIDKVRVAIIGAGNRGDVLIQMFDWLIQNNFAEIIAISDLR